jgi:uncharacterized protein YbjT (DUF2867 family)
VHRRATRFAVVFICVIANGFELVDRLLSMTGQIFAITAATGRIGGRVARGLLEAGHEVRVLGRDRDRLQPLVEAGAKPQVGDIRDRAFLERALRGANSALLVVRANRSSRDFRREFADIGSGYAAAARAVNLPAALFLSSTGAQDDRHRGLILVHRDVELALTQVPSLALTRLRAPFFLENLHYFMPHMKARGAAAMPIDPDAAFDAATTAEIAGAALRLLVEPRQGSVVHELRRQEPMTMRQVAAVLARELGRSFPFERITRAASVETLVGSGASADFAHLMNDGWDTFSGYGLLRDPGTEWSEATRPIEEFLRAEVVPALRSAQGS